MVIVDMDYSISWFIWVIIKCDQCGKEFLNASVAERIDDILDGIEKIASKIFILDYAVAA